ncbi:hypothetical protein CCP4SC76_3980003 [Gammaproteobacteria bacterium]
MNANATYSKFTVDFRPARKKKNGFNPWLGFDVSATSKENAVAIATRLIPTIDNVNQYKLAKVTKHGPSGEC